MTPEQKQAVSDCIRAFDIPRDARDFKLVIETSYTMVFYGGAPNVVVRLELDHALMGLSEIEL